MARVDAGDDSIPRWVVRHYSYDPERNERRHQVVAAFDNEVEYLELLGRLDADLRDRRAKGLSDAKENVSGVRLEAGDRERNQARRLAANRLRARAIRNTSDPNP